MKCPLITVLCLLISSRCLAGAYGEHKAIGDRGALAGRGAPGHSAQLDPLCKYGEFRVDTLSIWLELGQDLAISYGDLAALAGDHTLTAFELESHLASPRSYLHDVVRLQHEAAEHGHFSASNLKVALADSRYLPLALNNFSHFYDFGKSLGEHLDEIRLEEIDGLVEAIEQPLIHTNAIAKYCTLHAAALLLAERSGRARAAGHMQEGRQLMRRAFILNAFADHFLQDAFAPGHLILRRTVVGSYLTDLQLHDYYNRRGLTVVNLRKDQWTAYGDDEMFLHSEGARNTEYAIEATAVSFGELISAYTDAGQTFTNDLAAAAGDARVSGFVLQRFGALQIIPLPYNSYEEIERASTSESERQELMQLNTLDHEGPVVSRLGFEVVGGLNTDIFKDYGVTVYGGLSLKGIGFDKNYTEGAWHNAGVKIEHELKPHGRTVAWLEYQNVSNDYAGLRSLLPFDFLLGGGLDISAQQVLARVGVFVNYLPLQSRPSSIVSKLDPRLRILVDAGLSRAQDPRILKRVSFGIEMNLNPVIDLSLLPRY